MCTRSGCRLIVNKTYEACLVVQGKVKTSWLDFVSNFMYMYKPTNFDEHIKKSSDHCYMYFKARLDFINYHQTSLQGPNTGSQSTSIVLLTVFSFSRNTRLTLTSLRLILLTCFGQHNYLIQNNNNSYTRVIYLRLIWRVTLQRRHDEVEVLYIPVHVFVIFPITSGG